VIAVTLSGGLAGHGQLLMTASGQIMVGTHIICGGGRPAL
jgi:hypothetical protein